MTLPRRRRQKRGQRKQRDWKQIAFYVLSALVAISMASAYALSYLAGR
ncbi:MAG: hypothetical protein ACE5LU_14045 [Anaerolineae bacterium]